MEESWHEARLIPTSGITGNDEAERRATSALLAVMHAVKEFGQAMIRPFGAPAGPVRTFIEVPFTLGDRRLQPDGLIETSRGSKTWTALVEVKTGSADLEREQVEAYLDVAREQGFDVVLTISNQLAPAPGVHPVEVDKRKLRKVALHHLSWAEVLTIAVQHRVHRGVSDPDQAWILGELIRYLEHPRSGALDFTDMGGSWVAVRESVTLGTLRPSDKGLPEVVSRWEQLLRFAALRLGRELGADVQVALSRKEAAEPGLRFAAQAQALVANGTLSGSLRIPGAVGEIEVVADLRANRVIVSVLVEAPKEGRPATRVNWLLRQLRDAPDGLRVDALISGTRASMSEPLGAVRQDPNILLDPGRRDIRAFRVAAASALGAKRGVGRGGFIDSVLSAVDGFYEAVVQQLRPWTPRAPQLPKDGRTAVEDAGIDISPAPLDLTDEPDADLVDAPDEAEDLLAEVADAIAPDEQPDDLLAPPVTIDIPIVEWSSALDRLDQERLVAGPASPLPPAPEAESS